MVRKFFNGRNGIDNLSVALLFVSVLLSNIKYLWIAGLILLSYVIFRTFSKNKTKRYRELQQFNVLLNKTKIYLLPVAIALTKYIKSLYRNSNTLKTRLQQRKDFAFTKCPKCKNTLRLPRNKGKLCVTCPVCKLEFIKKV